MKIYAITTEYGKTYYVRAHSAANAVQYLIDTGKITSTTRVSIRSS